MVTFIIPVLAVAAAVFAATKLFRGVRVRRASTLAIVALVFGVLNALFGWLIHLLVAVVLIPAALVSFGLVYLFLGVIVNAILLWITDKAMDDFELKSTGSLFGTAFLITIVGWLLRFALHV